MNRNISIAKDTKIFYTNHKPPKIIVFLATLLLLLIIIILLSLKWDWFLIFLALAFSAIPICAMTYKWSNKPSLILSAYGFQYSDIDYIWDDVKSIEIGTDTQEINGIGFKPIYLIIDLKPLHHLSPQEQLKMMELRGNNSRLTIANGDADDYKLRELYDLFMEYWQPNSTKEYPEQIDIQYNKYFITSQSKLIKILSWLLAAITLSLFIVIIFSFFTQHKDFGVKLYGILISLVGFICSTRFIYANRYFYQSPLMAFNANSLLYYLPLGISQPIQWNEIESIILMRKTGWIFSQPYLCIYLKNEEEFIQKLSFFNRLKARYFQYKQLSPIHIHNDLQSHSLEEVYQQMINHWKKLQQCKS
ncbi:MAG: STM3941 family protein [Wohlfahrtiimonas sp.]